MAKNDMKVMVSMDATQLTKGAKDASNAVKGFGAEVKKTENSVKSIKQEIGKEYAELNKLTNAYRISKTELGQNAARTIELKQKIDQAVTSIARLKAEEQQVANAVKTATAQITAQGNAAAVTGAKINTMGSGVGALGGKFKGLGTMLSSATSMMGGSLGTVTSGLSSMGGMMSMVGAEGGAAAAGIGSAAAATGGVVIAAAAAGLAFKKVYDNTMEWRGALRELQNGLNITKGETDAFGESAMKLSNEFGRSATDIVGAFKAFADSNPGLEHNKEALEQVTSSALKLSIALGTDLNSSVAVLDTVMSQFNADASESEHYINVLAAATQNGASNLQYLQDFFSKCGTAAAQAHVPIEQMAAAANLLSQKAFDSSKAGAQMSMMITKLTTQSNSEFNPAIQGLDVALDNISKAGLNASEIADLFGKKGQQAGKVLLENIDKLKETAERYKNAQTAQDLFGIQSEKLGEVINRIKNTWDNFMTKLGESEAFNAVLDIIRDLMKWFEDLSKKIDEAFDGDATKGYADMLRGIWDALKPILSVIGDLIVVMMKVYSWVTKIIGFVAKLVAAWISAWGKIKSFVKNAIDGIKQWWHSLQNKLKDNAAFNAVVKAFRWVRDKVKGVIDTIKKWWNDLMRWFRNAWNDTMDALSSTGVSFEEYKIGGFTGGASTTWGDEDNSELKNNNTVNDEVTDKKDKPSKTHRSGKSGGGGKTPKSGKSGRSGGGGGQRPPAAGSIGALENEKSTLETALKNGWITNPSKIEDAKKRIKELKDLIEKKSVDMGLLEPVAVEGSLEKMEKELSEIQDKVKKGLIPEADIDKTNKDIDKLNEDIRNKKIELGLEAPKDSVSGIESTISQLQDKLKKGLIPPADIEKTNEQIKQLQREAKTKKIEVGLEAKPETDYAKSEFQREDALKKYKEQLRNITQYAENDEALLANQEAWRKYNEDREKAASEWTESSHTSEEATKSSEKMQKAMNALTEKLSAGKITVEEYDAEVNKLSKDLNTLDNVEVIAPRKLKAPIKFDLGNIPKMYSDMISEIDKMLSEDDLTIEERIRLTSTKQELQRKTDEITKGKLSIPAVIEPEFVVTGSINDMRKSYANVSSEISKIQSDYEQGIIKTTKERNAQVNELQRKLTALGLKPIQIELKTKGIEMIEQMQERVGQFQSLMGSLDGVKSFVSSIEEGADAFTIFSNAINAVMSVLSTLNQLMSIFNTIQQSTNQLTQESATAKEGEAAATAAQTAANAGEAASNVAVAGSEGAKAAGKAASQNAGMGPFGWIAGIAAALAIAGAIFGIISQAKGFAGGGIVTGNSTVGDKLFARLNDGEIVMNNRHQQRLMNILNGAPIGNSGDGNLSGEVRVKGQDLYIALRNYNKNKNLVGKNIGIK